MKKKKIALTEAQKQSIYDEIVRGVSYRRISDKFKIAVSTVSRVKQDFEKITPLKVTIEKKKITVRTKKKISDGVVVSNMIKKSDIIIGNILDVGKAVIFGAEKLVDIVENSEERVSEILDGLNKLIEHIENNIPFAGGDDGIKEKNDIVKDIYKVLAITGSYYSSNKIVIEAIRELRGHSETYVKLKMEADIIATLDIFVKSIFDALNLISDDDYTIFRDHVIQNSEMGKRLFAKFDEEVQV